MYTVDLKAERVVRLCCVSDMGLSLYSHLQALRRRWERCQTSKHGTVSTSSVFTE